MRFDEGSFLNLLKEPRPDPGGGSTAAFTVLVALSLAEKVCVLEIARAKGKRDDQKYLNNLLDRLRTKSKSCWSLVERDVVAYEKLSASIKRGLNWPGNYEMVLEAIDCPHTIMLVAIDSFQLISEIGHACSLWLIPDLLVTLELARASGHGAYHIAMFNLDYIEELKARQSKEDQLELSLRKSERRYLRVLESLKSRQIAS